MTSEVDDFHVDQKRRHGCTRACLSVLIVFILLFTAGLTWVIARSGLVFVPVITPWVFTSPIVPTLDVPEDIMSLLKERLKAAKDDKSAELTLSEAELTALVRQTQPDATIRLVDDRLEYYASIETNQTEILVKAGIQPEVTDGRLHLVFESLSVGQLPLPTFFLNLIGGELQKRFVDTHPLIKQIRFESVEVQDGQLIIKGEFPLSLFE